MSTDLNPLEDLEPQDADGVKGGEGWSHIRPVEGIPAAEPAVQDEIEA